MEAADRCAQVRLRVLEAVRVQALQPKIRRLRYQAGVKVQPYLLLVRQRTRAHFKAHSYVHCTGQVFALLSVQKDVIPSFKTQSFTALA